jgi:oxygen-independent coproporphyrinogen III oxidase
MPGSIQATELSSFISLYFHVPFCSKKCPYCHFYVTTSKKEAQKRYIEALLKEWKQKLPLLQGRVIYSIYFGGGTPSQLDPTLFSPLFEAIFNSSLIFHPNLEVTFEANPEDLSLTYLKTLKQLPVNRLSMGVQSFHDDTLKVLDRQHNAKTALDAIHFAHDVGFSNISIDLMYDLPHQTIASWSSTLKTLKNLPITHLSLYNLTIEPQTVFYKKRKILEPFIPDESKSLHLLNTAVETFEELGLSRYEISAFAKPGLHSKHNTGYWLGREFLGLGPSAFSYFQKKRFRNICDLNKYISYSHEEKTTTDFEEKLEEEASIRELLAIHLRLKEGVDLSYFPSFSKELVKEISKLQEDGLLQKEQNNLSLTTKGFLFYDTVAEALI